MFGSRYHHRDLIKKSNQVFLKYPIFFVPLFFSFSTILALCIYSKYFFPLENLNKTEALCAAFIICFIYSLILSIACFISLNLIFYIETNRKPKLVNAILKSVTVDIFKALPVVFIWAIIQFILVLINSSKNENSEEEDSIDGELSLESIAKDASGFSSSGEDITDSLRKGFLIDSIGMFAYLVYTGISWDALDFIKATKRATSIVKQFKSELLLGFIQIHLLSYIFSAIVTLTIRHLEGFESNHPAYAVIIFFILSFQVYLTLMEQILVTEIYLWEKNWREARIAAQIENKPFPSLKEIKRPSILDMFPDIEDYSKF